MAENQVFQISTVARVTRLPVGTLGRWQYEGLLHGLDSAGPAMQGVARPYSHRDVCVLSLVAELLSLGVPARPAISLAGVAMDAFDLHPDELRRLVYRKYPDDPQAHVTFEGQPFDPGAVLTLSLDLAVICRSATARLKADLAADAHVPAGE